MARGDVHWFAAGKKAAMGGTSINFASDTLKLGIVTSSTVPTVSTADPRWGSGGSTNFATNEIATGSSYSAGGPSLASVTWTQSSAVDTLDAADVSISQDASGATNAAYGIIYDSTDAGKHALGFVDLGGPVSLQAGPLSITWNGSGIFTDTAT